MSLAIVTGGSRGIGAAVARRLAADGFDVVISYLSSAAPAAAVVTDCEAKGVRALAVQADVSLEADCIRLAKTARENFGPVSVLVNNAGQTRDGLAMRMSLENFTSVLDTNLTGPFLMCKAVLPDMVKARRGRIINMASIAGVYGNAGQANYAASKAGLIGLTRSLAKEVGSRNITVNAIAPGYIETDMTAGLPENLRGEALKTIDLGRFGQPEDIAGAVAFLASQDAAYITGQVLEVSGGFTL
jgi:3-oxoacyl-[acyl-carrier protein] reductase